MTVVSGRAKRGLKRTSPCSGWVLSVPSVGIRYISYVAGVVKLDGKGHPARCHPHEVELKSHGRRGVRRCRRHQIGEFRARKRLPLFVRLDLKEAVVATSEQVFNIPESHARTDGVMYALGPPARLTNLPQRPHDDPRHDRYGDEATSLSRGRNWSLFMFFHHASPTNQIRLSPLPAGASLNLRVRLFLFSSSLTCLCGSIPFQGPRGPIEANSHNSQFRAPDSTCPRNTV